MQGLEANKALLLIKGTTTLKQFYLDAVRVLQHLHSQAHRKRVKKKETPFDVIVLPAFTSDNTLVEYMHDHLIKNSTKQTKFRTSKQGTWSCSGCNDCCHRRENSR